MVTCAATRSSVVLAMIWYTSGPPVFQAAPLALGNAAHSLSCCVPSALAATPGR